MRVGRAVVSGRAVVALVVVAAASVAGWWVGEQRRDATPRVRVLEALDGDTLVVELSDGRIDTIRILGVDTPNVAEHHLPAEARQRMPNAGSG